MKSYIDRFLNRGPQRVPIVPDQKPSGTSSSPAVPKGHYMHSTEAFRNALSTPKVILSPTSGKVVILSTPKSRGGEIKQMANKSEPKAFARGSSDHEDTNNILPSASAENQVLLSTPVKVAASPSPSRVFIRPRSAPPRSRDGSTNTSNHANNNNANTNNGTNTPCSPPLFASPAGGASRSRGSGRKPFVTTNSRQSPGPLPLGPSTSTQGHAHAHRDAPPSSTQSTSVRAPPATPPRPATTSSTSASGSQSGHSHSRTQSRYASQTSSYHVGTTLTLSSTPTRPSAPTPSSSNSKQLQQQQQPLPASSPSAPDKSNPSHPNPYTNASTSGGARTPKRAGAGTNTTTVAGAGLSSPSPSPAHRTNANTHKGTTGHRNASAATAAGPSSSPSLTEAAASKPGAKSVTPTPVPVVTKKPLHSVPSYGLDRPSIPPPKKQLLQTQGDKDHSKSQLKLLKSKRPQSVNGPNPNYLSSKPPTSRLRADGSDDSNSSYCGATVNNASNTSSVFGSAVEASEILGAGDGDRDHYVDSCSEVGIPAFSQSVCSVHDDSDEDGVDPRNAECDIAVLHISGCFESRDEESSGVENVQQQQQKQQQQQQQRQAEDSGTPSLVHPSPSSDIMKNAEDDGTNGTAAAASVSTSDDITSGTSSLASSTVSVSRSQVGSSLGSAFAPTNHFSNHTNSNLGLGSAASGAVRTTGSSITSISSVTATASSNPNNNNNGADGSTPNHAIATANPAQYRSVVATSRAAAAGSGSAWPTGLMDSSIDLELTRMSQMAPPNGTAVGVHSDAFIDSSLPLASASYAGATKHTNVNAPAMSTFRPVAAESPSTSLPQQFSSSTTYSSSQRQQAQLCQELELRNSFSFSGGDALSPVGWGDARDNTLDDTAASFFRASVVSANVSMLASIDIDVSYGPLQQQKQPQHQTQSIKISAGQDGYDGGRASFLVEEIEGVEGYSDEEDSILNNVETTTNALDTAMIMDSFRSNISLNEASISASCDTETWSGTKQIAGANNKKGVGAVHPTSSTSPSFPLLLASSSSPIRDTAADRFDDAVLHDSIDFDRHIP